MNPASPNRAPIVRFLGEAAGKGGPFALLGLAHAVEDASEIRKAQHRRLRQVDYHPHRATPDADEVRLAIHAAATQLLDSALRAELIRCWPEGIPVDIPLAWNPKRAMKQLSPAFLRSARRVIGSSGGWNPVARRRLAHFARINRVSALQVVRALGTRSAISHIASRPTMPLPSLPPEPDNGKSWMLGYTLVGVLACALIMTIVLNPVPSPSGSVASPSTTSELGINQSTAIPSVPSVSAERERLSHYTAIAHELDRLVARATTEPEVAVSRFKEIYPRFVEQWTQFPLEALERAARNIAEMTVRLEQQGATPEVSVTLFALPAIDPRREMIVAGVLEVVLSSPQLSAEARDQLHALRERMSDSAITLRTTLMPAIIDTADAMARAQKDDDPQWWGSWLAGVKHATLGSPQERTRLILEAMGTRLVDQTVPARNWLQTASILTSSLEWREKSAERFWLLAQFADPQVPTARLSMLTEAIATDSAAEGIDARMVLTRDANQPQRQQLAKVYRRVWFPESASSASANQKGGADDLPQQLELEVLSTPPNPDNQEAIDKVLSLTALWVAAQLRAKGMESASRELLLNPPQVPTNKSSPSDSLLRVSGGDQGWVEQAINSDSVAALRPLFDQLVGLDSIGVNTAHALVYLALRPQSEIRDLALPQLERLRTQPSVLLAIDHALSASRVSARLDEVVRVVLGTQLPDRNDPDWYPSVRSALLARLAASLGEHDEQRISMLEGLLGDMLLMLLTEDQQSQLDRSISPTHILELVNTQSRLDLESGQRIPAPVFAALDRIEAQRLVLRTRDASPMHRYLAELWYTFEIQAIAFNLQIPASARLIQDIRDEFQRRNDASKTLLQQITNTQRAIAQLWILQLERGGGPE